MKCSKLFPCFALAAGIALSGASTLSAADSYWERRDIRQDRQSFREDNRHISSDYDRLDGMSAHIAQDRARLNEDIRCGRDGAAARDAADLARDQRALAAQTRDVQHDRADWDRRY